MKPSRRLLLTVAACTLWGVSSVQAAIDPALLALVMPDATAVAGVQVEQSQASPFGQYLLSQVRPGTNPVFDMTGFDPRRDLREILIASTTGKTGMVLARGAFDPGKVTSMAVSNGAAATTYHGIGVLSSNKGRSNALAFLDTSTVVMGSLADVQAAIDRRAANKTFSGELAQKAQTVAQANHAWFATTASPADLFPARTGDSAQSPAGNLFSAVLQASGGLRFDTSGVTLSADALTRSQQDAQALVDVLKFMAGVMQMNRDQATAAAVTAILNSASFTTQGSTMHVSVTVPEDVLEQLVKPGRQLARR